MISVIEKQSVGEGRFVNQHFQHFQNEYYYQFEANAYSLLTVCPCYKITPDKAKVPSEVWIFS
jgi:hypothetical protein